MKLKIKYLSFYARTFFFVSIFFLLPIFTFASYYTLPIDDVNDPDISISSLFDHDAIASQMTKYNGILYMGASANFNTCTHGEGCYDTHRGVDYRTNFIQGKDIYASDSGVVRRTRWEDPLIPTQGYGFHMAIYHAPQSQCTVYAHLIANSNRFILNNSVSRGDIIASSGNTGQSSNPHLHFGVYGNMNDCVSLPPSEQIDPYGWSGTGPDPWLNTQGYLWTTNPPSLPNTNPTLPITTVTGPITQNTTWSGGQVYLINSGLVINPNVILTINPGAVIKLADESQYIDVQGTISVQGTAASPIYFTSYKDDTIGGDSNGDGASTTPAIGDYRGFVVQQDGEMNLNNTIIRYGGHESCGWVSCTPKGAIVNHGEVNATSTVISNQTRGILHYNGSLNLFRSTIASSLEEGIQNFWAWGNVNITLKESTLTQNGGAAINVGAYPTSINVSVSNSTISENGAGINISGQNIPIDISITDTHFVNNREGDGNFSGYQTSFNFINSGNTSSGNTKNGFHISGHFNGPLTLNPGVPFVIAGILNISSNSRLIVNPGTIVKFGEGSIYWRALIQVNSLEALGTPLAPIYFTSYHDDSIGGDSNGATTTPTAGDYAGISIGGDSVVSNAVFRYGGGCFGQFTCNTYGVISNVGANSRLDISHSRLENNNLSIYVTGSGTTTISYTKIKNSTSNALNTAGIYGSGPVNVFIENSEITGSGGYGLNVSRQYTELNVSVTNTVFRDNEFGDGDFGGYQTTLNFVNRGNKASRSDINMTSKNGFYLYGSFVNQPQTWNPGVPFIINTVSVNDLTINPGTVIKFLPPYSQLQVGTLRALGKQGKEIYFTSYQDDQVGGDSNGDRWASWPRAEDFPGLVVYGNGQISNAVFRYGGGNYCYSWSCSTRGVISQAGPGMTLLIDSSLITQNGIGIYRFSGAGNISITKSAIASNTQVGIFDFQNPMTSVSAINNWWGDGSGPLHTSNSSGLGDQILGNVLFNPWLVNCNFEGCVTS